MGYWWRFHSISFPSEWGVGSSYRLRRNLAVSIQLVSPASGELNYIKKVVGNTVSIQLVSPASGESEVVNAIENRESFHSISFPSEWGGVNL